MKSLLILCFLLATLVGRAADAPAFSHQECAASPSGRFIALSGIGLADVTPSFRMRMRILVVDVAELHVERVFTSLKAPWTIVWYSDQTLLACGRREESETAEPFVVLAYDIDKVGRPAERTPTEEEKARARKAFDAQHRDKKPNQAPEPTTLSVTPRAPSSTSRARQGRGSS